MTRLWTILVVVLCSGPMTARAAHPGEGGHSRHHVALFLGAGVETKRDGHDESAVAIGGIYEYRFHEKWGIGAGYAFHLHASIAQHVARTAESYTRSQQ